MKNKAYSTDVFKKKIEELKGVVNNEFPHLSDNDHEKIVLFLVDFMMNPSHYD